MDWHNMSYSEVCKNLDTDMKKGLSSAQVKNRLDKYGKNVLTQKKKQGIFIKFLYYNIFSYINIKFIFF